MPKVNGNENWLWKLVKMPGMHFLFGLESKYAKAHLLNLLFGVD